MGLALRIARIATACAIVGVTLAWLLALVPAYPANLLEHFRVQYAAVGGFVVGAAFALRMRGWSDAIAIVTLLHVLWIAPALEPRRSIPAHGRTLRVLSLNVLMTNRHYADVRALIARTQPDVIGLIEVDRAWLDAVAPAVADYPGRIEAPRSDYEGLALYSRAPVTGRVERLGGGPPSIVAALPGLHVIVTHTETPTSERGLESQRRELVAIADRMRTLEPVITMGDFNTTPWSRVFRDFLARSGACDSRAGFGVQASWPSASGILGIPIDHVVVSCSIGVADRRIEQQVGSDHLPVVVDLVVPVD